jgi:ATP:ADP antiporter, AAA family
MRVIRWQRSRGAPAVAAGAAAPRAERAVGGGVLAAFAQVGRSPYLIGIAVFVFFMTWVSTFFYLEQQSFVAKVFHSADERARFFATIDFSVQGASLVLQALLFSRLFKWFGMRALLMAVPLMMVGAYALYALVPTFMVLNWVYGVRRVADYAITRPCRDSLFTVVSREEKYQAKSLIDTFAYRGGDALSGSLYKAFTAGLGAGHTAVGWLGAAISALWMVLALGLGRAFQQRAEHAAPQPQGHPTQSRLSRVG